MPEESLEARLKKMESLIGRKIETDSEIQLVGHQGSIRESARVSALFSFVRELCLHAGLSPEQFSRHLQARIDHYHDFYLRKVQDADDHLSGRIDNRTLDEVPTEGGFPPLFPDESHQ